jgi:hypothetical protein
MVETVEKVRKRTKKALSLDTEDIPEEPPIPTNPELAAEAAKGWPQ